MGLEDAKSRLMSLVVAAGAVGAIALTGCRGDETPMPTSPLIEPTISETPALVPARKPFSSVVARQTFAGVLRTYEASQYRALARYWPAAYQEDVCRGAESVETALSEARASGGGPPPITAIEKVDDVRSRPPEATFVLSGRRSPAGPVARYDLTVGFAREDGVWKLGQPYPVEAAILCDRDRRG